MAQTKGIIETVQEELKSIFEELSVKLNEWIGENTIQFSESERNSLSKGDYSVDDSKSIWKVKTDRAVLEENLRKALVKNARDFRDRLPVYKLDDLSPITHKIDKSIEMNTSGKILYRKKGEFLNRADFGTPLRFDEGYDISRGGVGWLACKDYFLCNLMLALAQYNLPIFYEYAPKSKYYLSNYDKKINSFDLLLRISKNIPNVGMKGYLKPIKLHEDIRIGDVIYFLEIPRKRGSNSKLSLSEIKNLGLSERSTRFKTLGGEGHIMVISSILKKGSSDFKTWEFEVFEGHRFPHFKSEWPELEQRILGIVARSKWSNSTRPQEHFACIVGTNTDLNRVEYYTKDTGWVTTRCLIQKDAHDQWELKDENSADPDNSEREKEKIRIVAEDSFRISKCPSRMVFSWTALFTGSGIHTNLSPVAFPLQNNPEGILGFAEIDWDRFIQTPQESEAKPFTKEPTIKGAMPKLKRHTADNRFADSHGITF